MYHLLNRYIAIVYPIKAHILCTKKRTGMVITAIWTVSACCGTPTAMFTAVKQVSDTTQFCRIHFHDNRSVHDAYYQAFKYSESACFYLGPLVLQVILYTVITRRLFAGIDTLHGTRRIGQNSSLRVHTSSKGQKRCPNDAIRARRGVVKMLMVSVTIYFISYSPHQILLFYKTFSSANFGQTWVYHVLTMLLAYASSGANPVLYCVFSDKFRMKYASIFQRCTCCSQYLVNQSKEKTGREGGVRRHAALTSYTDTTMVNRMRTATV